MAAIRTQNLQKNYGKTKVLQGITLSVEDGTFWGLIGKNGAGKSTLINTLTGTVLKSGGAFWIYDTPDQELDQAKKSIGVMPDVSGLYGAMTGVEFLKYMATLKGVKLTKNDIKRCLDDVNLDVPFERKIKDYSFGMKKKISLAQALIEEPTLLFLDEPTSGVDPESILHLQGLFHRLHQNGTTIFLASHNLNEIERLCSHVAILDQGNFRVNGEINEVINRYTAVIKVQIHCRVPDDFCMSPKFHFAKLIEATADTMIFEVKTQEDISRIVELLVSCGISIYSVSPQKTTLEEIFLK